MDTAIALVIIAVAGYYVFKMVRSQIRDRKKGGCGCSGSCPSGPSDSCSGDGANQCSCDKKR